VRATQIHKDGLARFFKHPQGFPIYSSLVILLWKVACKTTKVDQAATSSMQEREVGFSFNFDELCILN
jgi:hypothetical protein